MTIKDTMRTKLTIDKSSENEEGTRSHKLIVRGPDTSFESSDQIAEEKAVAMVYNGISHAVMMATPLNLEDLALGFSLTEGIINDKSQFYSVDVVRSELGFECQIEVPSAVFMSLKQRRRYLSGRTGCGICGLESLEAVAPDLRLIKPLSKQLPATQLPSFDVVGKALKQLQDQQELRAKCGAVHAAALADHQGNIVLLREDVGRHNALDKLLGSQANSAREYKESFIVISSRASYEMIYKTAVIGIKTLVAASAPTAMAIELAQQANMNLIGFVREGRQLIYCQAR